MASYYGKRIKQELAKEAAGKPSLPRTELLELLDAKVKSKEITHAEGRELRLLLTGEELDTGIDAPFVNLVPGGWFQDLLEVVDEMESPRPFFVLSGMAVMGSMLGRRVYIDRGTHKVLPAPSVMLISPAGETRRSTACDFVVYTVGKAAGLTYVADSFSYEAFGDALAEIQDKTKEARALIYAGEMATLIGKGSYGESIIPKLTDLLGKSAPFHWRTVKRGQVEFTNPCINALLTTAPDWLADNIPSVVFGGGMASRFLMCVQERREKAVAWGDAMDPERILKLTLDLKHLTSQVGTFGKPSGPALDWYTDWYMAHSKNLDSGSIQDERMRPYLARKHDHLLRLSSLLALAAKDKFEFTVERFSQALGILDWLEKDVPKAYSAMALSPQAVAGRAVVKALELSGMTASHSDLHKKVYRQCPLATHFREVVSSLIDMGAVTVSTGFTNRGVSYTLRFNPYD